jgi:hypothetical protein
LADDINIIDDIDLGDLRINHFDDDGYMDIDNEKSLFATKALPLPPRHTHRHNYFNHEEYLKKDKNGSRVSHSKQQQSLKERPPPEGKE